MKLMEPFKTELDMQTGRLRPVGQIIQRRLSDMAHLYADAGAVSRILTREGDRLIYEVQAVNLPEEAGQVLHSTTILFPGRVGEEGGQVDAVVDRPREPGVVVAGQPPDHLVDLAAGVALALDLRDVERVDVGERNGEDPVHGYCINREFPL